MSILVSGMDLFYSSTDKEPAAMMQTVKRRGGGQEPCISIDKRHKQTKLRREDTYTKSLI